MDFESALAQFDIKDFRDHLTQAERERADLLQRFPRENWPNMTLEDYALGQTVNPNNFCRLLERKSNHLGSIRGGGAKKFAIYKRKDGVGWYYKNHYQNEHDAWANIRQAFVQMLA